MPRVAGEIPIVLFLKEKPRRADENRRCLPQLNEASPPPGLYALRAGSSGLYLYCPLSELERSLSELERSPSRKLSRKPGRPPAQRGLRPGGKPRPRLVSLLRCYGVNGRTCYDNVLSVLQSLKISRTAARRSRLAVIGYQLLVITG